MVCLSEEPSTEEVTTLDMREVESDAPGTDGAGVGREGQTDFFHLVAL